MNFNVNICNPRPENTQKRLFLIKQGVEPASGTQLSEKIIPSYKSYYLCPHIEKKFFHIFYTKILKSSQHTQFYIASLNILQSF